VRDGTEEADAGPEQGRDVVSLLTRFPVVPRRAAEREFAPGHGSAIESVRHLGVHPQRSDRCRFHGAPGMGNGFRDTPPSIIDRYFGVRCRPSRDSVGRSCWFPAPPEPPGAFQEKLSPQKSTKVSRNERFSQV